MSFHLGIGNNIPVVNKSAEFVFFKTFLKIISKLSTSLHIFRGGWVVILMLLYFAPPNYIVLINGKYIFYSFPDSTILFRSQ